MALWQRIALVLLAGAMVWVMIATWGSIGSAVMAFGLITLGAGLLHQRFVNRDEPDVYE